MFSIAVLRIRDVYSGSQIRINEFKYPLTSVVDPEPDP
jgi:hypothetical protein